MKKLLTVLGYFIVLFLLSHLDVQARVHVDLSASGSGDGTFWINACSNVQSALTWTGEHPLNTQLRVVDTQGMVLLETGLDVIDNIQVLDIGGFSSGNFYLVLESAKGVAVEQFTKMPD